MDREYPALLARWRMGRENRCSQKQSLVNKDEEST
jgi:hypothetical protein